jgi:hypothetical protein
MRRTREIGRRLVQAWERQVWAWEVVLRAPRAPWEEEGPLRWRRRLGTGWELHGTTLPGDVPAPGGS